MKVHVLITLATLLCFASVTSAQESPSPQAAVVADRAKPSPSPRAPLSLKWIEHAKETGQLALTLRVQRVRLTRDVEVVVEVPEGFELVSGERRFMLGRDGPEVVEKEYAFAIGAVSSARLVATASVQAGSYGARAKAAYRYGTTPSLRMAPKAPGPELRINGKNFGPSVQAP